MIETLGSKGARYKEKIYPVKPVSVHDVCGAGDVFLAATVAKWLKCGNLHKAISTANACAALSVTKPGTYILSKKDYENINTN